MGGATAPPAFEVVSKSGEARRGCLKGKIETPAPLLYTRRGFPPPLTLRELDALAQTSLPGKEGDTGISSGGAGRALALQINAADFFEQDNRGAVMAKCEGGVRRFCGLGERDHLVLLTHRDALNLQTGMPASDGWVTMQTPGGQLKVTADEYVKFVGSAAPDVAVCLSDEVSADSSDKRVKKSIDRSAEWTSKCLAAREAGVIPASTLLLAPVLGGIFERERSKSAADAALSAADGYAISGLGGWESPAQRASLVALTIAALDGGKPRVLLGVGNPLEVLESVALGVDLVETAYPYTVAAQGLAITFPVELDAIMAAAANTPPRAEPGPGQQGGKLNLRDSELRKDGRPLVEGCTCVACQRHTRAYIHHLLNTREMLAEVLLNTHNQHMYLLFFESIRAAIERGALAEFTVAFNASRRAAP